MTVLEKGERLEQVAADGMTRLFDYGGVVIVLILIVLALCWFCVYLLKRNTALADRFVEVVIQNTQTITEFKEALRDLSRKN